ncbi:hypothetical protein P7C70_g4470, partial [Phenoliferia sp. Uapishka_3]
MSAYNAVQQSNSTTFATSIDLILDLIIEHLVPNLTPLDDGFGAVVEELARIFLVCRAWRRPAVKRCLMRDLSVSLSVRADRLITADAVRTGLLFFVRSVSFEESHLGALCENKPVLIDQIIALVAKLPNLTCLDFMDPVESLRFGLSISESQTHQLKSSASLAALRTLSFQPYFCDLDLSLMQHILSATINLQHLSIHVSSNAHREYNNLPSSSSQIYLPRLQKLTLSGETSTEAILFLLSTESLANVTDLCVELEMLNPNPEARLFKVPWRSLKRLRCAVECDQDLSRTLGDLKLCRGLEELRLDSQQGNYGIFEEIPSSIKIFSTFGFRAMARYLAVAGKNAMPSKSLRKVRILGMRGGGEEMYRASVERFCWTWNIELDHP